jgi:hypothetical protein
MKFESQLQIVTAAGVPPFTVNQAALVINLNADLLDGQHGSYYAAASSLGNYLPLTGGTLTGTLTGTIGIFTTVRTAELTSLLGSNGPITITPDGTGHVHINSTDIRLGPNNTNATLATRGTGDLILRTHEGSAVEGFIRIYDGANGNIEITPNGTGTVVVGKLSGSTASFSGQVTSTVATGTAPLVIASTTAVANLNADLLDGQHGSYYQDAGNLNAGTVPSARLSGSYGISITGSSYSVFVADTRSVATTPQSVNMGVFYDFKQNSVDGLNDGGTYFGEMTFRQYGSGTDWSGGLSHQLGFTDNGNVWQRSGSSTTWGAWKKLLDTTNFSSHALPLTGGTLTGALNGTTASFSGNVKGGRVTLRDDCLEQHVDDSDGVGIFVNYFGYASGTTRFRNFGVFNGKNQQLFYITGSTGATAITGTLSVTGAITQGGNQVLHAGNYGGYSAFSGSVTSGYGTFASPGHIIGDAQYGFYVSGGNLYYKSGSGGAHYWRNIANSAETMSLDNSGNLLLSGSLRLTDTTTGISKSGGRLSIRSESTDDVANFASYGLYLPKSGQTAGLYVESAIEARAGIRLGTSAANGTITVGADTANTANRLVQRDGSGNIAVSGIKQGADLARPLASWGVSGTSTGMVIFSFPGGSGNYGMVHCVFDIYEYNSNTVSTVIVGGHNWNGQWYNTGSNVIGRCGKTVRLGFKDGKYCVVFGGAASSWEYGTIVLRKIHNGAFYTGIMDMGGAFTTSQTATESFTWVTGDLRVLRSSAAIISDDALRGTEVYSSNWFRNDNSGSGIYNSATSNHFYSDGPYWNVAYSGTQGIRFRNGHNGTILGYIYAETDGNFGLLSNNGGWAVQVKPGGGGNLNGTWTINSNTPLTSANYSGYALPITGGTVSGQLSVTATTDPAILLSGGASADSTTHLYTSIGGTGKVRVQRDGVIKGLGLEIRSGANVNAGSAVFSVSNAGALNAVGAITQNGNQVLHAGNYTSYTAPNAANLPYSWSNTANVAVFSGSYGYNSGVAKYLLLWQRTSGATGTNGRFVDGMLKVWRGANHAGNGGTVGYVHASSGYSGQSSEVLNYTPFSGQGLTFSSVVYNSVEWIAVAMPVSDYFWEFRGNYGIQGDTTTVPILVQAGQAGVGAVTNLATGSPIITSSTYSLFSSFTGTVSGSNFSGPGTGLTGLAAGLSIGGSAAQLNGQAASYYENRDTTAVGFSGGTLTLTRAAGNLTASLDGRYLPLSGGTLTGILNIQSASDNQLLLQGTDTWAGIGFRDSANVTDFIWYWGATQTFAIGGGGSAGVSGKKLHIDGGVTIGSSYDAVSMPTNGLNVEGAIQQSGNQVLHAGNYTGYFNNFVQGAGSRGRSSGPAGNSANNLTDPSGFYFGNNVTGMPTTDWWNWTQCIGNSWSSPDGYGYQLAYSFWSDDIRMRRLTSGTWNSWVSLLHSGNYNNYTIASRGNVDNIDFNTYGNYNMNMVSGYIGSSANKPTNFSYGYGTTISFSMTGSPGQAQFYVSHAGNDLCFRGGWNGSSWQTWNKCLTDQNFPSINTYGTSIGNTLPDRVFMSNDANIKYAPRDTAKAHLGLTAKYANSRPNITGDSNYWTGTMGWANNNWNSVFDWGSGIAESWDTPSNNPGDTSHHLAVQAVHYTNGSSRYGWQLANGGGTNRWWLRDVWGGSFSSWREIIHAGNYTNYPPARWATGRTISLTGDVTGTSVAFDGTAALSFAATIANSSVTYAKIQNVAVSSVLGNSSASVAQAPQALSMATLAGMLSGQTMNIAGSSTSCTGNAATATNVAWSGITSKPTTFSGYGISDLVYGSTGSRNVWTITDWNQTTYPNAHFLSSEGNTTNAPSTDFIYGIQTSFHRNASAYRTQMVTELYSNPVSLWVRNSRDSDTWTSWAKLVHSLNYTDYTVTKTGAGASGSWGINITGSAASATLATKASTLSQGGGNGSAMTFNWAGQSGQPSWLWGSNDGVNIYVWNPSNFSVASAASCSGSAAQLNGQAASYYENRDTTSVSISAGTLTLGRGAGNLTTTIGGRVVAWCDFNGNFASSQSPNASFNVSSITKNATGDYTVNFSSSLGTANYVVAGTAQLDTPSPGASNYNVMVAVPRRSGAKAAGSCRVVCEYPAGVALYDSISVGVAFIAA